MKTKSTIVVIAIIILSFTRAFSQAPAQQWDADFGGTENEQLFAGRQTSDGGYIFGGYSESGISGDKTQESRGSSDYWIVKTDANGIKQWDARFGGTSVDQLTALQQTADGGYILGGISFSGIGGDKSEASRGNSDYWIVKVDANGIKQWDARFGGTSQDELHSLQQTADGGYILGGASRSDSTGDVTQRTRGGKDFWIVKTDANGVKQWDARFGGTQFEELFSVRQATDGGYILGGYSLSEPGGDKTQPSRGRYDFWVVKTTAIGSKQWDATFGGSDDDWLTQLRQTTDGGYMLGGWSWSPKSGDKSQPTKGDNDYWMVKIDAQGDKDWDADLGGSSNDYLNAIEQTTDGGYILGGYSSSPVGGDKTENTVGGTDYWIVKTNEKGKKQWDANFGGSEFDFLYALQQTTDGGYMLAGYSASNASGDKTQDNKGPNDYWIVKTSADGEACNQPTNLTTTNIGAKEATLNWDEVAEAGKYIISYRKAGTSRWRTVDSKNNREQLHGLSANTEYEWRVRSVCNRNKSVLSRWSVKQSFTTRGWLVQAPPKSIVVRENSFGEVFPNPVTQLAIMSFSLSKASPVMIDVIDIYGRSLKVIANKDFAEGIHQVKFSRQALNAGVYFLRAKTNQGVVTKKIVVQ